MPYCTVDNQSKAAFKCRATKLLQMNQIFQLQHAEFTIGQVDFHKQSKKCNSYCKCFALILHSLSEKR